VADQIPDSTKLLLCPFCGGPGHLQHSTFEIDAGWHVVCHGQKDCPLYCSEPYQVHGDEADAVTRWNTRAAPPAMDREAVDFLHQLRRVNTERYEAWVEGADAGIMFDALELGGEVGELLNVVKKLEREERGWRGSRADPADFADECADVLICLDKLARRRGVDLIAATTAKFNATSDKVGLPHKLSTLSADAIRQGEGEAKAVIAKIAEAAHAIGIQAGVGGRETAGAIVSYLMTSPEEIEPFINGKLSPVDFKGDWISGGSLSWHASNGRVVFPATPASHASDGGKA